MSSAATKGKQLESAGVKWCNDDNMKQNLQGKFPGLNLAVFEQFISEQDIFTHLVFLNVKLHFLFVWLLKYLFSISFSSWLDLKF